MASERPVSGGSAAMRGCYTDERKQIRSRIIEAEGVTTCAICDMALTGLCVP